MATLYRWSERLRDRARTVSFLRFLWQRFLDDRLFESAGALSFTTVFALVPLTMVVFGVLSLFPAFGEWSDRLGDYVFSNFVPASAQAIRGYLHRFLDNSGKVTTVGAITLVASLLVTLVSVEGTFNKIWRVQSARPRLSRFLIYWTVLTLGVLVATASLALATQLFALEVFRTAPGRWLEGVAWRLAPVAIEFGAFAAIYRVVPHRTVQWRHALAGAALAVLLLELVKWGIGLYLASFNTYQTIYQKLAFLPISLLWIYFGWVSILLGASFASSISAFRYQPLSMRLPAGHELYALLRLLGRFALARREGRGLHIHQILQLEPMLTDALAQQLLAQFGEIGLAARAESGEWLLARDLDDLTLAELYEACQLRIPIAEAQLPCRDDPLGIAATGILDDLRLPLRELLKHRVGSLYDLPPDMP